MAVGGRGEAEGGVHLQLVGDGLAEAAGALGMDFYDLPFSPSRVTPDLLLRFARMVGQARKPILVYCRSGARSTGIFRMALEAGYLNPDDLSLMYS